MPSKISSLKEQRICAMGDYLSHTQFLPNMLFKGNLKAYYKVRQLVIIKCDSYFITKLQSVTGITKCDSFITKCDRYNKCDDFYNVRQNRHAFVLWPDDHRNVSGKVF